jgi:hypothetical protein
MTENEVARLQIALETYKLHCRFCMKHYRGSESSLWPADSEGRVAIMVKGPCPICGQSNSARTFSIPEIGPKT